MFSPDVDDHSFSPNRKINQGKKLDKRKISHRNTSDGEESEESCSKPKRSLTNKNDSTLKHTRLSNGTISTSNNNSLSHPALSGKKSGLSHSTPINDVRLTPTKGRRSLIIDKFVLQDDDEINDDAEELRVERENQVSGQNSTLEPEKGLKSLEILAHCLDSELSTEQLAAHLASCIELNAANKININNAFNLKLIDYMVVLLKRNDKTMKDFPTMSCSLDASTRIYACRVDNVHAGVMELVSGLASTLDKQRKKKSKDAENQDGEGPSGEDDDDEDGDRVNNRGRTKKRKTVLASSEKAVSRNCIELANWMTRKAIEPNFTVLFNAAKLTQSADAGLSLLKDSIPLISEKTPHTKGSQEKPTVEIEFPELSTARPFLFGSSLKFNWDEQTESQEICSQASLMNEISQEKEHIKSNELALENGCIEISSIPASISAEDLPDIPSDNDADDFVDNCMPDESDFDVDEPEEKKPDTPFDLLMEEEQRCESKQNRSRKKRVDALNLVNSKMILADDENDYSYMNTDVLPLMWAGPDHWKPVLKRGKQSVAIAECAEKKMKKIKRKVPEAISYDDFSMIDSIFSKKINAMLQSKAVKKWSEAKVTFPMQKEFKVNILYRSFLRKTLFWKPLVKTEKDGEEIKIETEYADDLEDTTEDDDGIPVFKGVDDEFDRDDQESVHDDQSENGDFDDNVFEPPVEEVDISEPPQASEVLFSNKLVPIPRMVDCGTITYATVPKRVNMKQLKETCWNLMDFESDKENEDRNTINGSCEKAVQFSKLYFELPNHLSRDTKNDLSPALAFLSILHLANEKMLQLCPVDKDYDKETNSDFLIKRFI